MLSRVQFAKNDTSDSLKLKALLRRAAASTFAALFKAIKEALVVGKC